jgi:hypothetical protein
MLVSAPSHSACPRKSQLRAGLLETPSDGNVDLVEMAQLGLLDCQDYDLMRKRLIQFGLGENELSLMGLMSHLLMKSDGCHGSRETRGCCAS